MELSCLKLAFLLCFCILPLYSATEDSYSAEQGKILYLMQSGQVNQAIEAYKHFAEKKGQQDLEVVQQMALQLLFLGSENRDPEIQLLTLFGAGISGNEKAIPILQQGLASSYPQLQLVSLNFLSQFHNDEAEQSIERAMASNHLLVRLETCQILASNKSPEAIGHIESLMSKISSKLLPLFPKIFALAGGPDATRILLRLMHSQKNDVAVEAILSAANFQRDDLIPSVRSLSTHHFAPKQEACAYALGILKDDASLQKLIDLSRSSDIYVKLAALFSQYQLGQKHVVAEMEDQAQKQNLFAIALLGKVPESRPLLYKLSLSENLQVRINAAIALLENKDPRCLGPLSEILIKDSRDLALLKVSSPGKTLTSWKVIPSAKQNLKEDPFSLEISNRSREMLLSQTIELPEKEFLAFASHIFEVRENELVPMVVKLLENLKSPEAIAILKKQQEKIGAPFIRNSCNLALYRLGEAGPYEKNLYEWLKQQQTIDLIQFKPFLPFELRDSESSYQLTPEETSQLLVESLEALARSRKEESINILLDLIRYGNAKNKYALAGLLLQATL